MVHCENTYTGAAGQENTDRNIPDCGRYLDASWCFYVCRSCQAKLWARIMTGLTTNRKGVRDSRHVWQAKLSVNVIEQNRFCSLSEYSQRFAAWGDSKLFCYSLLIWLYAATGSGGFKCPPTLSRWPEPLSRSLTREKYNAAEKVWLPLL